MSTAGQAKSFYARLFREQGFITALVDVPSDRPYGVTGTDPFRVSKEHLEDVKTVINFLSQKWPEPIYLIGHSAGATSVALCPWILRQGTRISYSDYGLGCRQASPGSNRSVTSAK